MEWPDPRLTRLGCDGFRALISASFFYSVRRGGVHAIYGHDDVAEMVERLARKPLPDGVDGYLGALPGVTLELFGAAADGTASLARDGS